MGLLRETFAIDLRSLAAFRVAIAIVLIGELADRVFEIPGLYTDEGVVPRAVYLADAAQTPLSLHMLGGSTAFAAAMFAVQFALAVMLLVGWRSRIAAALSFVLLTSLLVRNPLVNHAGDHLLRFLLLWSAFLPIGGAYALDARRAPHPPRVANIASAALLLQPVLMYTVAAVSKMQYDAWLEGRAIYAIVNKAAYARPLSEWIAGSPVAIEALTYSTVGIEAALPILLLVPWQAQRLRVIAFALNTALQLGIFFFARIGYFQILTIFALLPFLPASVWDRFTSWQIPDHEAQPQPRWQQIVVGALLAYVVASNVQALRPGFETLPGQRLQLAQRWRMFANADKTKQGWHVVVGRTKAGAGVDVRGWQTFASPDHALRALTRERPADYSASFPNHAWRVYWSRIVRPEFEAFRPELVRYHCALWNDVAQGDERLVDLVAIWMREVAVDPSVPSEVTAIEVARGTCW